MFIQTDPVSKKPRATVAALSLLVASLRITARHPLSLSLSLEQEQEQEQWSLLDLQCNRAGHLLLTLQDQEDGGGDRRLEQYSLRSDFQLRGGWMAPIINKLVVPPDAFVTGDQVLLHKDASNTPGGNMPLVLLLRADSHVFQAGVSFRQHCASM